MLCNFPISIWSIEFWITSYSLSDWLFGQRLLLFTYLTIGHFTCKIYEFVLCHIQLWKSKFVISRKIMQKITCDTEWCPFQSPPPPPQKKITGIKIKVDLSIGTWCPIVCGHTLVWAKHPAGAECKPLCQARASVSSVVFLAPTAGPIRLKFGMWPPCDQEC